MMTGSEALNILVQHSNYLDKNFVEMSDGAIAFRLREMEEALKAIKNLMGVK